MKIHRANDVVSGKDNEFYRQTRNQIDTENSIKNERLKACSQSNFALFTLLGVLIGGEVYVYGSSGSFYSVEFAAAVVNIKLVGCAIGIGISIFTLLGLSAVNRAIKDRRTFYENSYTSAVVTDVYKYPWGSRDTQIAGMLCEVSQPFLFTLFWIAISGLDQHVMLMVAIQTTLLMIGIVLWPFATRNGESRS